MNEIPSTYAAAGVDIEAGNELVRRIKPHAARTLTPGAIGGIGGFGALFQHDFSAYAEPILVSATDGVGTKLKLAFALDRHNTVGIDLVAMCVNDVLCLGAQPLFFLDYFATGKLSPASAEQVVKGIADGCVQAGCALIGGETAEMPGLYAQGEYDLAGFCVGVVDKPKIIDGSKVQNGDIILGLSSSGLHSNGYSLARRVLEPIGYASEMEELDSTLGEAMLRPTNIYVKPVLALAQQVEIKSLVHITGGGFYENIPRSLPKNCKAQIQRESWPIPPIFALIQNTAKIAEREMFTTFNMGIGLVAILSPEKVEAAQRELQASNQTSFVIGEVVSGDGEPIVELI